MLTNLEQHRILDHKKFRMGPGRILGLSEQQMFSFM